MRKQVYRAMLMAAALGCTACAKRDPRTLFAPESGTIVVDAFLTVGMDFPQIRLSKTVAADGSYSLVRSALQGAQVVLSDSASSSPYAEDRLQPGIYYRQGGSLSTRVRSNTVYALDIRTADGRRVHGTTRTPQPLTVASWVVLDDAGTTVLRALGTFPVYGDSVFSVPENQLTYAQGLLEARFDPTGLAGLEVGLFSRTPGSPLLVDPDYFGDEEAQRNNSSPPFSPREGNVRLPWLAVFYEGRYVFKIWSMDANWYDLARTDPALRSGGLGFGGQAGDSFERPIFHLDGAIGLFGSGSVDSIGVTVHPRP